MSQVSTLAGRNFILRRRFRSLGPFQASIIHHASNLQRNGASPSLQRFRCARGRLRERRIYTTSSANADAVDSVALHARNAAELNHTPVLLQEILGCFRETSLHTFVDGTLGAGGHSTSIAQHHQELLNLLGIDQDQSALDIARPRVKHALVGTAQLHLQCGNFRDVAQLLSRTCGTASGAANGILLDLGVSSMQVDQPQRGFSFMQDGPLDMRMSRDGESAEALINTVDEAHLGQLLRDYGEERSWRSIASRIVAAREKQPIVTTHQLVDAIGGRRSPRGKGGSRGIHPATRTFQALRIAVNDELGALTAVLPEAIQCLAPGGRLAVISFHSLEDRIVKRAFLKAAGRPQDAELPPIHLDPRDFPEPEAVASLITRRPITAGEDEARANPRSRSAKLRILQKL